MHNLYVGNDIICLKDVDNIRSANSDRYRSKTLTSEELAWVDSAMVFLKLWSVKESVYKVLLKQGCNKFNNYKRIEVTPADKYGLVFKAQFEGKTYYSHVQTHSSYLYGETVTTPAIEANRIIIPKENITTLTQVSQMLYSQIGKDYDLAYTTSGIPYATDRSLELSISHDGPWISVCYSHL